MPAPEAAPRPHILTVNLEDYFQVGAFNKFVQKRQWYRFESRIEVHAERTLDLLDRHGAKATFFVLGWVADNFPDVVRKVAARGHEIASRGYYHRGVREMTPDEFRTDLARAKASLENACGRAVVGYRTADGWFGPEDLWALDVLADEGYVYDSSIAPVGTQYRGEPWRRYLHDHARGAKPLFEVPVSSVRVLGRDLPIGGGNWVRQLPTGFMRRAAAKWAATAPTPLVMYFHTWELDDDQPRLSTAGRLTRVRQYRNLAGMEDRIAGYLKTYTFTTIADYLNADRPAVAGTADLTVTPPPMAPVPVNLGRGGAKTPVTIVVPLFNEGLIVPYLANTLAKVRESFAKSYDLRFILVDDGSRDDTWPQLEDVFGTCPGVDLVRHDVNRGVAAAIATGIRKSATEIVCSMDADCTYDPFQLLYMIPKLAPGVDMVTASPYHPQGSVRNVPRWRLVLSKTASRMYRRVFRNRLHTYTSCFRVYRRSAVVDLPLTRGNFLGVIELLGLLDERGGTVVEHPATLEVRMLGRSKMKTVRTIFGHLRMMARFRLRRRRQRTKAAGPMTPAERDHALKLLFTTASTTVCHAALEHQPAGTGQAPPRRTPADLPVPVGPPARVRAAARS